jgi:hypothetical protein
MCAALIAAASTPLAHGPISLAAPFMVPTPATSVLGQVHIDHEGKVIAKVIRQIRASLSGIQPNLPEIKGLRIKQPEQYAGKDDFDRLDNWLQGLLCYFKLNHLTVVDRDADHVLVTGTCLRDKAECWFNHKVEHPTRVICDWTFESVIIGLFRAFITTAMAQQAVQKYAQIRYS